jgi:AcrR family transcriptional regulator
MARPNLQPDEIAAFRGRLAVVGARLFAEHGFEGVTLRAVAAELGISAMTPYRYVADKDELLALVRTAAFGRFADAQEAAAKGRGDALARLRRLGRAYVAFAIEHPNEYRMMFELRQPLGRFPEQAAESARAFRPLLDATHEAVAAGLLEGDPLTRAHLLWATTHGLVTLHLAGKLAQGRDLEELSEQVIPTAKSNPNPNPKRKKP